MHTAVLGDCRLTLASTELRIRPRGCRNTSLPLLWIALQKPAREETAAVALLKNQDAQDVRPAAD
jgi:hypothetical protein